MVNLGSVIAFAYDGSLNGDWVAHYAVRFAANTERRLRLLHIETGSPLRHLDERVARIQAEASRAGVSLGVSIVHAAPGHVTEALLEASGEAPLVTGTRARPRDRAFLADTVAARLLERGPGPVIAVHVAHPGVLGQPGRVLVPFRGAGAPDPSPMLRLLGAELEALHVLLIGPAPSFGGRLSSVSQITQAAAEGRARVEAMERRIREGIAPHACDMDGSVSFSSDPAREIRLRALAHRSRLICLDAGHAKASIEAVLAAAPADVAIHRWPS